MKKLLFPVVVLFILACNSGEEEKDSVEMAKELNETIDSSQSASPDTLARDDIFMVETYSGTKMEIQLGNYAATNAASQAVKQFGQMMVREHSKADSALTVISQVKSIALPNVPGDKHQERINELTRKKGAEFDKDYMKLMVDHHEDNVKKFEEAAEDAKDAAIRDFAAKTLPVLKSHLEQAKKIKDALK